MENLKNIIVPEFNESEIANKIQKAIESDLNLEKETLLKLILSLIDLTSLNATDTDKHIAELCKKVLTLKKKYDLNIGAVCTYPNFSKTASTCLNPLNINVASVATGFPSGQTSLNIKKEEIEWAINEGANEIDVVISRGELLAGNYQKVYDEIVAFKEVCNGKAHLKVILETGELKTHSNIKVASDIAIMAGADFIKTSTGKISIGATYDAVYIMLLAIKEHYDKTGVLIGIKPSGGISDVETASNYIKIVNSVLGEKWLTNTLFRFGASSLANNVLNELADIYTKIDLKNYF